jgi:hypothetical protein
LSPRFRAPPHAQALVSAFKSQVEGLSGIPAARQRFIFKGRVLRDEQTLADAGDGQPGRAPPAGAQAHVRATKRGRGTHATPTHLPLQAWKTTTPCT